MLDGLRPGSFVAPESGNEHFFRFNDLTRTGGKKVATGEILDSNEGTAQDQGNSAWLFPMDIYFTGDDYQSNSDLFFEALGESYTNDTPGKLIHPRWGDVDVMPIRWTQKETFLSGAGVSFFSLEFRKIYPNQYPTTDKQTQAAALNNIDEMAEASQGAVGKLKIDNPSSLANLKSKVTGAVSAVSSGLNSIAEFNEAIITEFEGIQDTINNSIDDIGGSITNIVASTQYLIRLPGRIVTDTQDKINGYRDMIEDLIFGLDDTNETVAENKINNAIMFEVVGGTASAALAEAALYTNYETRGDASDALETVQSGYSAYLEALESVSVQGGNASQSYTGDHNFLSLLQDTIARISAILLDKSFDLKTERRLILSAPSDPITLCNKFYKSVSLETLEFFNRTNELSGDEFIELPAGREVVAYG